MQEGFPKYNEIISSGSTSYGDHNACQHTGRHHHGDVISHMQCSTLADDSTWHDTAINMKKCISHLNLQLAWKHEAHSLVETGGVPKHLIGWEADLAGRKVVQLRIRASIRALGEIVMGFDWSYLCTTGMFNFFETLNLTRMKSKEVHLETLFKLFF